MQEGPIGVDEVISLAQNVEEDGYLNEGVLPKLAKTCLYLIANNKEDVISRAISACNDAKVADKIYFAAHIATFSNPGMLAIVHEHDENSNYYCFGLPMAAQCDAATAVALQTGGLKTPEMFAKELHSSLRLGRDDLLFFSDRIVPAK